MRLANDRLWLLRRLVPCLSAGLIAIIGISTTFAETCNPVPGDESDNTCMAQVFECPAQSGGLQNVPNGGGGTAYPQSAIANISSYNPSPVYNFSTAWSALEQNNQGAGLIAQVGWIHDTTSYNEYAFAQITDGQGHFTPVHSFYATPSGVNYYAAYRQSNGTFDLEWSHGTWLPGNQYNCGSDSVAFEGEIGAFDRTEGDGDHFPGNRTTPVTFTSTNWTDQYGVNHVANLGWFAGNMLSGVNGQKLIPPFGYLYHWDSANFEIWDNRCV